MEISIPLLGDKFPEMTVQTTHGKMNLPGDLKGKWFVLFSHPGDFTPVCTTEFVAFQNRTADFRKLNCELIGLSVDQVFSHMKWTDWIRDNLKVNIEFPIIADELGQVATRLGLIHPAKGSNTVRAVFIVDANACVRIIFYYPQELGRNIDEILRSIKGMQTSDEHKCAIPANWPNNELIQDRVIVPPPKDEKTARTRLKEHEGYDWWFCHKKL